MPDITQLPILQTATNQTYLISVDNGIAKRVPLTGVGAVQGYAGSIGSTGPIGYTGSISTVPGYAGSRGYAGSQGIQGIPGAATAIGYYGSQGYTGSTGPSTLLNVSATNTSTYEYVVGISRSGTDTQAVISTVNPFVFVPSAGRVGIGNNNPLGTLHLRDAQTPALYLEQGNTSTMHRLYANGGSLYLDIDSGNAGAVTANFYISQAGTNKLALGPQGYFGVNTNIPSEALDVAGKIRFASSLTSIQSVEGYGLLYQNSSFGITYETQKYAAIASPGYYYAGTRIGGTIDSTQSFGVMDFYLTTNVNTTDNQTWEKVLELRTNQIEAYQNFRIDGDLEVDGGDIVTLDSTFNLLNTTATTVNAFGVAGELNIGTSLSAGTGIATFGHHSLVGTNSTQYLFDTIASTVNAFGNASTLNMGGASGIATLRNPTLVGVNTTQNLYNTVATTVNFAGQATTLNMAVDAATPTAVTIGNSAGTVYIPGSLEVKGAVTYLETTNTAIKDALVEIHTAFNGSGNITPLTNDDGADIGLRLHYYNGSDQSAALVMAHDTRYLEWYQSGAENLGPPDVFAGTYGTFKTANIKLVGVENAVTTNTGALQVVGGVGIGGNIYTTGEITINNPSYTRAGIAGYSDVLAIRNRYSANGNKFVRIDPVGSLEIINSGYGATLLALTDAGNLILSGNIPSTSATTGTLVVTGGAGISGNIYVGGNTNIAVNLNVTGESVLQGLTATVVTATSITVSGNGSIGSSLTVTGFSSLNGGATISAATVTNNLSVNGESILKGVTATIVTATSILSNVLNVTTTATADIFHSTNDGNGTNFQVGNDAWIGDINVANTIRVMGQEDATQGYIVFGNSNATSLGRTGTGLLTYGGVAVVLADSTTTNARTAITVTQSTTASTSTLTYTTGTGVINYTPAFGLGLQGETWHNVLSSPGRLINTTYTNTNAYPIMVNVSLIGSNALATSAVVGGIRVAYDANTLAVGTWTSSASFIVPPKTTYICSGTGVMSWAELY